MDVRGTMPRFGSDPQLAASRGVKELELPGSGFGVDVDAQAYAFRWKAVTFGVGGQLTIGRSHASAGTAADGTTARAVTERFTSFAPQLSFNFGNGNGWSYVSGGIGPSKWSIVPEGAAPLAADRDRLKTINYGGGARWFLNSRLAFTFDVRFYAIDPGQPELGMPGSPRTKLLILGAGVALK